MCNIAWADRITVTNLVFNRRSYPERLTVVTASGVYIQPWQGQWLTMISAKRIILALTVRTRPQSIHMRLLQSKRQVYIQHDTKLAIWEYRSNLTLRSLSAKWASEKSSTSTLTNCSEFYLTVPRTSCRLHHL